MARECDKTLLRTEPCAADKQPKRETGFCGLEDKRTVCLVLSRESSNWFGKDLHIVPVPRGP